MNENDSLSLLGFLVPGIIHEFKNSFNRINLLAQHGLQPELPEGNQTTSLENISEQVTDADRGVISVLNRLSEVLDRSESDSANEPSNNDLQTERFPVDGTAYMGHIYHLDYESENALAGSIDCLGTIRELDVYFRILQSTCKWWGVALKTGDLPSSRILDHGQHWVVPLMKACRIVCGFGGTIEIDFPSDEAMNEGSGSLIMRLIITPSKTAKSGAFEELEISIRHIFALAAALDRDRNNLFRSNKQALLKNTGVVRSEERPSTQYHGAERLTILISFAG